MADGWRLARSLEVLEAEIQQVAPGTTVWDIGDQDHQDGWSDHNPNDEDVVCAIDALPDGGLDLGKFAEKVRASRHPALKYVIYNRRIASRSRGWSWRPYRGSNPHTGHAHISVGRGPDGRSTGPYDDTSPWGIDQSKGDDMIGLSQGDSGEQVKALQALITYTGVELPEYGIDGEYDDETAEGLRQARALVGSRAEEGWGGEVTGYAYAQLMRAVARAESAGDVELPDSVSVSGELDVEG